MVEATKSKIETGVRKATKSKIETGVRIDILDNKKGRPIIYLLSGRNRRHISKTKRKENSSIDMPALAKPGRPCYTKPFELRKICPVLLTFHPVEGVR